MTGGLPAKIFLLQSQPVVCALALKLDPALDPAPDPALDPALFQIAAIRLKYDRPVTKQRPQLLDFTKLKR